MRQFVANLLLVTGVASSSRAWSQESVKAVERLLSSSEELPAAVKLLAPDVTVIRNASFLVNDQVLSGPSCKPVTFGVDREVDPRSMLMAIYEDGGEAALKPLLREVLGSEVTSIRVETEGQAKGDFVILTADGKSTRLSDPRLKTQILQKLNSDDFRQMFEAVAEKAVNAIYAKGEKYFGITFDISTNLPEIIYHREKKFSDKVSEHFGDTVARIESFVTRFNLQKLDGQWVSGSTHHHFVLPLDIPKSVALRLAQAAECYVVLEKLASIVSAMQRNPNYNRAASTATMRGSTFQDLILGESNRGLIRFGVKDLGEDDPRRNDVEVRFGTIDEVMGLLGAIASEKATAKPKTRIASLIDIEQRGNLKLEKLSLVGSAFPEGSVADPKLSNVLGVLYHLETNAGRLGKGDLAAKIKAIRVEMVKVLKEFPGNENVMSKSLITWQVSLLDIPRGRQLVKDLGSLIKEKDFSEVDLYVGGPAPD